MKRGTTNAKTARQGRSDDEGASGEGDLRKYNTMDGMAAVSCEANKPATAASRPSTAGRATEREKHAADVTLASATEAATPRKERGQRLSQEHIHLTVSNPSWQPAEPFEDPDEHYARLMSIPVFSQDPDDVERSTELQRELVETSKLCTASVERFHAWVRREFEEKGYVDVDDYIPEGEDDDDIDDELFALAFGPMDGVVAEDEDDEFALDFGPMDGVVAEDDEGVAPST